VTRVVWGRWKEGSSTQLRPQRMRNSRRKVKIPFVRATLAKIEQIFLRFVFSFHSLQASQTWQALAYFEEPTLRARCWPECWTLATQSRSPMGANRSALVIEQASPVDPLPTAGDRCRSTRRRFPKWAANSCIESLPNQATLAGEPGTTEPAPRARPRARLKRLRTCRRQPTAISRGILEKEFPAACAPRPNGAPSRGQREVVTSVAISANTRTRLSPRRNARRTASRRVGKDGVITSKKARPEDGVEYVDGCQFDKGSCRTSSTIRARWSRLEERPSVVLYERNPSQSP